MIKKVKIEDLQPGVFIDHYDGGWMKHPFIFNKKKIKNSGTIRRLSQWGIKHVFIDTERGLDVGPPPKARPRPRMRTEQPLPPPLETREVESKDGEAVELEPLKQPGFTKVEREIKHIPIQHEITRAKQVRQKANKAAHRIMEDVSAGKKIVTEQAYDVVTEIDSSICHNKDAMLMLMKIRHRDEYTYDHSVAVSVLLLSLCRSLGMDDETSRIIGLGGLLHDVGKMIIPKEILNKPAALNKEEYETVKQHVLHCGEILSTSHNVPHASALIASEHHERFDGSGYPKGLTDEEISIGGQMAAIADVFDALTSDRCYRDGIDQIEVLRKLYTWSKTHFNEELVHQFIRSVGIYPVGTLVQLESGLIGVVAESTEDILSPVVRVIYDVKRDWAVRERDVDLSQDNGKGGGDRIVSYESAKRWRVNPFKILGVA